MSIRHTLSGLTYVGVCVVLSSILSPGVQGQTAPALIEEMAGNWKVRQRMWPGSGAKPVDLPPAVAHRRLVEGAFLEEVMELEPGSSEKPFARTAYFNFNATNRQYEYFSLDSRLPQMMNERSRKDRAGTEKGKIVLDGGRFIAPKWGNATNVAFTYRLIIGQVEKNTQVVQLYLTPQAGKSAKEFLAFEYDYTRQR